MLHSSLRYSVLVGLFALSACSSGDDKPDGAGAAGGTGGTSGTGGTAGAGATTGGAGAATSGSAGMPAAMCTSAIVTTPENNYKFTSDLTISLTPVKPDTDLTIDWSGVTTDFLKRPVDLNKVDMVEIGLFERTLDQFEDELNNDTLMNPLALATFSPMGATTGHILGAEVPIGNIPPEQILTFLNAENYPPANHLYAVMIASGMDYGRGTYMLGGFKLDPTSTNTTVNVTSASTTVKFEATIASRPPTYIPAGNADVSIDWTKLKLTAAGNEFLPASITRFRIGHYTQTPQQLEGDNFLQLDELASEMYETKVKTGTSIKFSEALKKTDSTPFAGITDQGTSIVALNCGDCQNPAPWYLAVLKPCPASP